MWKQQFNFSHTLKFGQGVLRLFLISAIFVIAAKMKCSFLITILILAICFCIAQTAQVLPSVNGQGGHHDSHEDWQVTSHASAEEAGRPGVIVVAFGGVVDALHDLLEIVFGRPYY